MEGLYNLNRENTLEQPASDNDSFLPCNRLKTKLSDYEVKLEHNESSYRGKMSEDQDNIDNCRSYEETDSKITVKQVGAKFDETDQKKYLMRTTSWSMDSPKPVPLDFCGTNNRQRVAFIVKEFELSRLRNFEREVSSLKKLSALPNDRDNISAPKLFATCKSKQYYAIIMEYVPGKTLKKVLEDFKGKMPEHVVRSIVKAFMDYLKWLNSVRVMHLDIKPDNVIVRFNCKTLGVKISVSCQSEESQSTSTSSSTNDQSAASNESYDIDYNRELKLCFIDYDLSVSFDDLLDEKKYPYYAGGTPIYASPNMIYRWLKVLNDKSNCPKDKDLSHDVPLDPKMDFHSVAFILHEFRYETPFFAEAGRAEKEIDRLIRRFELENATFNWTSVTIKDSAFLQETDSMGKRPDKADKWLAEVIKGLYKGLNFKAIDEAYQRVVYSTDAPRDSDCADGYDPYDIPSRKVAQSEY